MRGILVSWVLISCAASAEPVDLFPQERVLLEYFAERCNTAPDRKLWPIGFEHPSDKIACDTLYFAGLPFNHDNRFLFHRASVINKPDYWPITRQIEKDFFGADQLARIDKEKGLDALKLRASLGDPFDFNAFALSPDSDTSRILSKPASAFYGPQISLVFEPTGRINFDQLNKLILWVARHNHELSPQLFRALAVRISNEFFSTQATWLDVYKNVLSRPYDVRASLLSIWSLVDVGENTQFRDFLQAINWSGTHYDQAPYLANRPMSWSRFDEGPLTFFSIMRQLEDIAYSIQPGFTPTWGIRQALLFLKIPEYSQFSGYFPNASKLLGSFRLLPNQNSLGLELEDFERWITGDDKLLRNLALLEVVSYANGSIEFLELSEVLAGISQKQLDTYILETRALNQKTGQGLTKAYIDYAFEGGEAQRKRSSIGIDKTLIKFHSDIISECDVAGSQSSEKCFRKWTAFPTAWFSATHWELSGNLNACEQSKVLSDSLIQKLFSNRVISTDAASNCTFERLRALSGNKISLPNDLALIHGFPNANGGIRWSKSPDSVLGMAGSLPIHWLNSGSNVDFPITGQDQFVSTMYNRAGWSFLNRFTERATHSLDYLSAKTLATYPSHTSYAAAETLQGRYEQAFQSSLKAIEARRNYSKFRPFDILSEIFFLGKNLGIPRSYLATYLTQHEAFNWPPHELKDSSWEALTDLYLGYLSGSSVEEIKKLIHSNRPKEFAWALGAAYSLGTYDKAQLCLEEEVRKIVIDGSDSRLDPLHRRGNAGIFARFEDGNLNSICRVMSLLNDITQGVQEVDEADPEKARLAAERQYKDILEYSFNPFILSHQNFVDLRYLDSITAFSILSAGAEREIGVLFSLLTLKAVYVELAKSFVDRDSLTLRTEQWRIETALTSIGLAIQKLSLSTDQERWGHLWELHTTLMLSAHQPLLSDKSRLRMLMHGEFDDTPEVIKSELKEAIDNLNNDFREDRIQASKAKTILEYIETKTSISSRKNMGFLPFRSAGEVNSKNLIDKSGKRPVFINLVSNGTAISAVILDRFGEIKTFSKGIRIDLGLVRQEINQTADLSDGTLATVCDGFSSFHESLKPILQDASEIHFVPSVNLLPLPPEIILGFDCMPQAHLPIFVVNDFTASEELTKKKVIMNPPDSLVAVGNPSVNEEIEINLGELRSAGFLTTEGQKLDLSKLPPLPDAEIEITAVKDLFEESEVFLGYEGNVLEAFGSAGKNTSQNKSSLLIMATHGFSADETEAQSLPGLLSVAGGKPEIVTSLDVYNFDLKNAVVLLSACSTASGFAERPDTMFTGFVKSISDTGASLIVSSLWPVNTLASRNLTENFVKTWKATNNLNSAFLAGKKMKNPNWTWPFLFIYP